MTKRYVNMDSAESVFFERQLEHLKSKAYDVLYPELKARSLFPVSGEAGPGAETIKYEQYDSVGMAKIIAAYSEDLPRADVKGKEFVSFIRSLGDSYGYSLQEVRASKMANKNLEQRRANAAKKAILTLENKIAFFGDAQHGLIGFINHPNISSTTIANDGTGAATTFASKTPLQIIRDMNKLANFVVENTKEVEKPDTMLLPTAQLNYISSTPIGDNADKTILQYFLANSLYIKKVESVMELKAAGSAGTDRMMVYHNNADKLTLEIPQDFEQLEEQPKGLEYIVPCHSRCGGVIIYYPLSVAYADGI